MGFFSAIGSKISQGANWLGRKVGQGAQYVGQKVSDLASAGASIASKIPGADLIAKGLSGVAAIGNSAVNAGKALVGGHGGLGGVSNAIQDGIAHATGVLQAGNDLNTHFKN